MELEKKLSIVIPCKNESETISKTLDLLNYQEGIENVDVIVADSSTDNTVELLSKRNNDKFKLLIVGDLYSRVDT
jgi:glycosyltransferase involved in cell wall biosynthesis